MASSKPLITAQTVYFGLALVIPLLVKLYQIRLCDQLDQATKKLNQTLGNQDILVFARVPKTASLTVNAIVSELKDIHDYKVLSNLDGMPLASSSQEYLYEPDPNQRKKSVLAFVDYPDKPLLYTRHQTFWDFSEFQQEHHQPMYFSFVRDPVDRVISWYYYMRSAGYQLSEDGSSIDSVVSVRALKESLEDCLLLKRRECQFVEGMPIFTNGANSHSSQLAFFCGHSPACNQFESKPLFAQAVHHFQTHFSVVGLTEHFNPSLKVLEAFLPRYFKGATSLLDMANVTTNTNPFKPKVSAEVRHMLAKNMSKEIEFYHLAKQRLFKQLASLYE